MTELLNKAFASAAALPDAEQDALAAWILEELADEARWQTSFRTSAWALERLALEALDEIEAGQTQPLDLDLL